MSAVNEAVSTVDNMAVPAVAKVADSPSTTTAIVSSTFLLLILLLLLRRHRRRRCRRRLLLLLLGARRATGLRRLAQLAGGRGAGHN
jgi:hypothetical protein